MIKSRIAKMLRRPIIKTRSVGWANKSRFQFGEVGKGVDIKYTLAILGIINGILPMIGRKLYLEGATYKSGPKSDYRNWDYSDVYFKIRKPIKHEQREEIR